MIRAAPAWIEAISVLQLCWGFEVRKEGAVDEMAWRYFGAELKTRL
ncbi:hypothetical protein [Roseateles sp.]